MVEKKTAWELVLDEPVLLAPGERPMKVQMDAKFDGSFEQFVAWMSETFKNPTDMRVSAVIGNFPITPTGEPVKLAPPSAIALKLRNMSGRQISLQAAEELVKKTYQIMKTDGKLQAIKALREATSLGLKDSKEFVESLPVPGSEEEIPF